MANSVNWDDYKKGQYGGNQVVSALWNWFSNPMADIPEMIAGNSPAAGNPDDPTRSFTDPFGIGNKIRGKTGAWNSNLAADENKDVFDSMSDDDWAAFANLSTAGQNEWIKKRKGQIPAQSAADKAAADQKAKEAQYAKWRDDTMHKLSDFADKMNMSVDDLVKSGDTGMMANRTQAANNAAMRGQGLSGGVSNLNSERAVADASLKYQMGRQQMGLQATGALMGGLQQQYMNDEQKRQYEQGMNLQLQQAQAAANQQKYLQQQQQASGLMGMIGTGVGAYFGGAAGAQAGGQLGQSFGSQQYGQNNPYQPYQYQYPNGSSQSGSGGGGLGGGNRFGGAQ